MAFLTTFKKHSLMEKFESLSRNLRYSGRWQTFSMSLDLPLKRKWI
jgi:hypothetical protein